MDNYRGVGLAWSPEGYLFYDHRNEFVTMGPHGPYIDTVISTHVVPDPLWEPDDVVTGQNCPVIDTDEWHLRVAGKRVHSYPAISVIGDMLRYEFHPGRAYAKPMEDFYREHFADREPDPLELMYPHATEILKGPSLYQEWVWDAVAQVFPRYAECHRPKAVFTHPVNVGTVGHIDFGNEALISTYVRLAQANTPDERSRVIGKLIGDHGFYAVTKPNFNV